MYNGHTGFVCKLICWLLTTTHWHSRLLTLPQNSSPPPKILEMGPRFVQMLVATSSNTDTHTSLFAQVKSLYLLLLEEALPRNPSLSPTTSPFPNDFYNTKHSIRVMGRLSTVVAAAGVDAGNLPERLPNVSLIDALLPASWSSRSSISSKVRRILTFHASTTGPSRGGNMSDLTPYALTPPSLTHFAPRHLQLTPLSHYQLPNPKLPTMPFFIQPFFRKPFKLFAIDADTGQPLDPNVRKKTRVTYYELEKGSNGSKRLVAHKKSSQTSKQASAKGDGAGKAAEEAKKDGGEDSEDKPWTAEQDKIVNSMKAEGKTWAQIGQEVGGRGKHEVSARWKVLNPNKGQNDNAGKKDNGGGGGNQGEQTIEKNKGGNKQANSQGQGKKNKNNNNNQNQNQNNNNQQKKNDNNKQNNNKNDKSKNQNAHQNKSYDKPTAKQSTAGEARFTMNDWLTLQEDDLFSFGELQCLSELIAKDLNQGWQRVAAKFFDLTGRRVHPDDVREKFENMAVVTGGKK